VPRAAGTGSEIMQRIAVPMIGGMISSTLLTLIVIPAIFGIVKGFGLPNEDRSDNRPPFQLAKSIKRSQRVPEPTE
jgi:copper/silver efflux system protein